MDFANLTEEQYNQFLKDAQGLKDDTVRLSSELAQTQAELEQLHKEKAQAEALASLTSKASQLRSQAETFFQNGQIDPVEFNTYFSKDLQGDLALFADPVELAITERFMSKVAQRPISGVKVNVKPLGADNSSLGNYKSILTAENLVS